MLGRGIVLRLGLGRDGLESVVRARLGLGSEPGFREVTGLVVNQVSGQRLG